MEMKRFECCTDKSVSERERLTAAPALHSHAAIHTHIHAHTHLQTVINHFSLIFLVFLLLNLLSAIAQEYVYTPTHLSVYVSVSVCLGVRIVIMMCHDMASSIYATITITLNGNCK